MMQLDDLRGLEVRRGDLGEIIGQHGGNREVGRDEHGLIVTGSLASAAVTLASLSSVQPVVPTTTSTPRFTSASTLSSETDGTVNSTTTSVFSGVIRIRSSPASSAKASCMSCAPFTASTT